MIPVYTAESSLDAQLVQDLLVGAGITAHIFGGDVAGAIAEVPKSGLIRVFVEEGEADLARTMIQDWQTAPAEDEDFDLVDSFPLRA